MRTLLTWITRIAVRILVTNVLGEFTFYTVYSTFSWIHRIPLYVTLRVRSTGYLFQFVSFRITIKPMCCRPIHSRISFVLTPTRGYLKVTFARDGTTVIVRSTRRRLHRILFYRFRACTFAVKTRRFACTRFVINTGHTCVKERVRGAQPTYARIIFGTRSRI